MCTTTMNAKNPQTIVRKDVASFQKKLQNERSQKHTMPAWARRNHFSPGMVFWDDSVTLNNAPMEIQLDSDSTQVKLQSSTAFLQNPY